MSFMVWGLELGVWSLGLGFRVWGLGFRLRDALAYCCGVLRRLYLIAWECTYYDEAGDVGC